MHLLFKAICRPLADADKQGPWAFYKGHRLVAIDGSEMTVRVIDYQVFDKDRNVVGTGRLTTSLLDAELNPIHELVVLYHER